MPTLIPHVLAVLPGVMPSTQMDVVAPLLALEKRGRIRLRVALENYPLLHPIDRYNLVVFCRNSEPKYQYILDSVIQKRIPYIYDLDDNFFEVPPDTQDGQYYRVPERIALLKKYLQNAGLVRIYSRQMFKQIEKYNSNVALVKPPLDLTAFSMFSTRQKTASYTGAPIKIVYATSRSDDHLVSIFTSALQRVLREHPKRVEMHFWGYQPQEYTQFSNVHYHKFTSNYIRFSKRFSQAGFQIGLAPLVDDIFHRSKTNNKYREYAACGIAGVYSNTEVYTDCVKDRQTGMLVTNQPEDWYAAIKNLIEDRSLCTRIGQAARDDVEQIYKPKEFQETWLQQIYSVLQTNRPQLTKKMRWASDDAPNTPKKIWRRKIGHGISTREKALRLLAHSNLHLANLWWLFKVNTLKKL